MQPVGNIDWHSHILSTMNQSSVRSHTRHKTAVITLKDHAQYVLCDIWSNFEQRRAEMCKGVLRCQAHDHGHETSCPTLIVDGHGIVECIQVILLKAADIRRCRIIQVARRRLQEHQAIKQLRPCYCCNHADHSTDRMTHIMHSAHLLLGNECQQIIGVSKQRAVQVKIIASLAVVATASQVVRKHPEICIQNGTNVLPRCLIGTKPVAKHNYFFPRTTPRGFQTIGSCCHVRRLVGHRF
ncbi:Uncharacterised protein [Comamonas aquatica]|uniref:Uncharacterized protein n=1 Tax=Comamonas aquatica TaxID=225991 RepID=A0AA35D634_9BURK|nr:Uncharacterised protein [Comamonas aquatica]CAB5671935.1 Uncharacterised protein [Comamonas aquatica]CAC9210792.1 Uncharacterised protein [Comamonas aquatica]CAC9686442.1 Uncharacterised protein [Comamonas aquatica]